MLGNNKTFDFSNGDNDTFDVYTTGDFDYYVKGAENINLKEKSSEPIKFAGENLISGTSRKDINFNLSGNTVDFTTGESGLSSGLSMSGDKLVFPNDIADFIADGSSVIFSNGTIKVGFDSGVKFAEGVNTVFTISSGDKIKFDEKDDKISFESYAFLNTANKDNNFTFSVKDWGTLSNNEESKKMYADTYDDILRNYYNQTDDKGITGAFNSFGKDAIVQAVENFGKTQKLTFILDTDEHSSLITDKYNNIYVGTNENNDDTNITFNNIYTEGDFTVELFGTNQNDINFAGTVTLTNGINGANSTEKVNINFGKLTGTGENNSININGITLGKGGTISFEDTSVIENLGKITANNGETINVEINKIGANSTGFNKLLSSVNVGVSKIKVVFSDDINDSSENIERETVDITENYSGKLSFSDNYEVSFKEK